MELSKKHVGPSAAVKSTTEGSEKEAKPSVASRSWLHRSSTGNGVEELSDKKKKKKKKIYITFSEAIAKLHSRILYRLYAV